MKKPRRSLARSVGWTVAGLGLAACYPDPTTLDCALVDVSPWAISLDVRVAPPTVLSLEEISARVVGDGVDVGFFPLRNGQLVATVPLGTYDVTVEAVGFLPWRAYDVVIRPGACGGFDTVRLVAALAPATE